MPQHVSVIYLKETGIPNICFVCADPFALIHNVQLQFAVHFKRLLLTAIDSERYEVLKNESVKNANCFS